MRKIVLLCAGGMSTSILVKTMQAAAKKIDYQVEISAHSVSSAKRVSQLADIVLLGPQIRHRVAYVMEEVSCPVEVMEMRAYGTMNGEMMINRVKEILKDE